MSLDDEVEHFTALAMHLHRAVHACENYLLLEIQEVVLFRFKAIKDLQ